MAHIRARAFLIMGMIAALVVPFGASGAVAEGETSAVTSLTATHSNGTVSVAGAASFIRDEVVVGTSPAGTSELPPGAPGTGMDLAAGRIRQISQSMLEFNVDVRDMPKKGETYGVNEIVHYDWDFNVVKNGALVAEYTLQTIPSAQGEAPGSLDPVYRLLTCVPNEQTGNTDCSTVGTVEGKLHATGITYKIPTSMINSVGGAVLEQNYDGIAASYGASGAYWYTGGDRMPIDNFAVATPTVELGIAPAATPDAEVALTSSAPVNNKNGSFAGSLAAPTAPGEYKVVAKACLADSCGLSSTPLLVP